MNEIPPRWRRLIALAQRDPRRAAPLARRALQRASAPAAGWARYTQGCALLATDQAALAEPELRTALAGFEAAGADRAMRACQHALLAADLLRMARPGLEHDLAALAEECDLAGDTGAALGVRIDQARLLYGLGRADDAAALLQRIEPGLAGAGGYDRARFLRFAGAVATLRDEYARAEALLAQAATASARMRSRPELAKCWIERGWLALRQGQLARALEAYERAERVFQRFGLPLQQAICAKNIGLLFSRRGDYDQALQATLAALAAFRALGRRSDIGAGHLHIGNIYYYAGRWSAALAEYARAEAIYAEIGMEGYQLIARRNRTMIYAEQHKPEAAHALLDSVEALAQKLGDQSELAEARRQRAWLLAEDGRLGEATALYIQARALFEQLGDPLGLADSAMEQGWLALRQAQPDQARALFELVAPLVAQLPYNRWRTDHGLARCAELAGDQAGALAHYRAASAAVARLRQSLASEDSSSALAQQAEQLHHDALRLAAAYAPAELLIELAEAQRALVLARLLAAPPAPLAEAYRAEHERLHAQIAVLLGDPAAGDALDQALAAYAELLLQARHGAPKAPAPLDDLGAALDLAALRAQLAAAYGDDWTALVYVLAGDTLLIATVALDSATLTRTRYDGELAGLVAEATQPNLRAYIYDDLGFLLGERDRPWDCLHGLAERLLPPEALARLHPGHRLLIVPAGPLHALPWPALRLAEGWLAERAVLQLAPSLVALGLLLARRAPPGQAALLVGCAEFGDRAEPLPEVGAELDAVAAGWPGPADQLRDRAATRAALLGLGQAGALAGYGLVHIASHARLLSARGIAAHLKLWDADMLLPEVAGLRLAGALVVLAACDGAAADTLPGDEVLSLSWALLVAGARSVLASLWPVEDSGAHALMALLYHALAGTADAALALALAQRQLIATRRATPEPGESPAQWASYMLLGAG